jgi:DNA-binding FadR family transcriptional regulator
MQPIKRITVTDNTIEAIKQYLLSGNVKRGVKIMTENELAALILSAFGVASGT